MALTTIANVADFTGQVFTAAQDVRLTTLIPIAERQVARLAGSVFYDAADVAGDASQDWLLAVSLVAEQMLRNEDPAVRAALAGPFQSENFGGEYSYSIKSGAGKVGVDPAVLDIIARYRTSPALAGVVTSGPTRIAPVIADPDLSRALHGS